MTRWLAALAVLTVAVVAAVVSFTHIETLALVHGQSLVASRLTPVSVDGAVIASSLALLDAARRGLQAPVLARIMLAAGVLATLAANAVSGAGHGPVGVMVAMLPALSFIGSVEVLLGMVRGRVEDVPEGGGEAVPEAGSVVARARTSKIQSLPGSASRRRGGHRAPEAVFAAELEAGKLPGIRAIKSRMSCGQDMATSIKADLEALLQRSVSEPIESMN